MNIKTSTDVATEPVLAADLRGWLALDSTDQDTMLGLIAKTARQKIERLTGLAIAERTITYMIEMPNYGVLELPYPPCVSITSVKTIAQDGTTATIDSGSYALVNNTLCFSGGIGSIVEVVYKTGITATETEKQLIMKQGSWDYMHRGDSEVQEYSPDVLAEIRTITINNGF
jgi:hypothetical protein